jgi:methylmalonyl-CoA/ethylmalonyl-CoA epimerase
LCHSPCPGFAAGNEAVEAADSGSRGREKGGATVLERISHVGIVVGDMEKALHVWRDVLGLKQFAEADVEVEGIHSVFLSVSGQPGEMTIELMQPTDQADLKNPVARRLAEKGEGFYHIAVVVNDVPETAQRLKERKLPILERPPIAEGRAGRWLVHPKAANGVMIEGIEEWAAG